MRDEISVRQWQEQWRAHLTPRTFTPNARLVGVTGFARTKPWQAV